MPVRTTNKAFPTAKGAGAYALGGTGGAVIHVTTLVWDAVGGLKEALQTTGARTIVFDVSGEIDASSESDYSTLLNGSIYDNLTIAGQTAPNGGISVRTSEFIFQNVDNVIIRYVRFRNTGVSQDALWFINCNDVIFDHCTFSHGGDEAASVSASSGTQSNITFQHCFLQDSKTGTIMGVDGGGGQYSSISNLFSNISHRFPNTKGIGRYDIINNVVYNWKARLCRFQEGGEQNLINNYYKPSAGGLRDSGWYGNGATTNVQHKIAVNTDDITPVTDYPVVYAAGSIITGERETPQTDDSDTFTAFFGSTAASENDPVPAKYFTGTQYALNGESFSMETAAQSYISVLADSGANKTLNADGSINNYQDTKDAADVIMIIGDTYSGAFYDARSTVPYPTIPNNTRPVGYYSSNSHIPETWFSANVPNGEDENDLAPSGYTWMEEFLNQIDNTGIGAIPVITLVGDSTINLTVGDSYTELGATAVDAEDGDITNDIIITGTVDTNTVGTYYKFYDVQDSDLNNASQVVRTINVSASGNTENNLTDLEASRNRNTLIRYKFIA